jgi:hypothetical protein
MALMQWGDHWVAGCDRAPVKVVDRASGGEIQEIIVTSCDGRPLGPSDVMMVPGPGAAAATRERLSVPKTPAARRRSSPVRAGTDDLTRGA